MKLTEGMPALDFTAIDIYGNEITLSNYKGKKILLGFYRHVSCPFCNRRVHEIMGNSFRFRNAGVQIVLLFESSNKVLSDSVFHKGVAPWPLIGNPEKNIYNLYGVENSMLKTMKTIFKSNIFKAMKDTKELNLPKVKPASDSLIPADFFIDENFNIVKAHYGAHADDHIDMEQMKEFAGISR